MTVISVKIQIDVMTSRFNFKSPRTSDLMQPRERQIHEVGRFEKRPPC